MNECSCGDTSDYHWCPIHVDCDQNCKALREPTWAAEILAAYKHWRNHGFLSGCSHGE